MQMKRTKKEFTPYNDYEDRPFGLKWGTAFAVAELTQTIEKTRNLDLKIVNELPIMNRDEIDEVLQKAFLKSLIISIQLTERDDVGRLLDSIEGKFSGIADEECLYINDTAIEWSHIRNIKTIK